MTKAIPSRSLLNLLKSDESERSRSLFKMSDFEQKSEERMSKRASKFPRPLKYYRSVSRLRLEEGFAITGHRCLSKPQHIWLASCYSSLFQSLSDYLGSKQFLMGDQPSVVDCALFGMILQLRLGVREDCVYR